jgi:SAM-dependent methyltransferase
MVWPALPTEIELLPGTDVDGAWERFEVFEALHHGMRICNPMTGSDLDLVLAALDPQPGETWLDIACGHGELLIRGAEHATIRGVGVDLSPWVLERSLREAESRCVARSLTWVLGDAHALGKDERFDIVTCLGASWIWHGFAGTAKAQVARARAGSRIAIGDLRLQADADPAEIAETYGTVLTADEQQRILGDLGVSVIERIDAGPVGWDGYQERIMQSAETWVREHPGPKAEEYLEQQHEWRRDHDRDRTFLDWTVWVGTIA